MVSILDNINTTSKITSKKKKQTFLDAIKNTPNLTIYQIKIKKKWKVIKD